MSRLSARSIPRLVTAIVSLSAVLPSLALAQGPSAAPVAPAAPEPAHVAKARAMIAKGAAFLRAQQDQNTGGWSVPASPGGSDPDAKGSPHYPAITALAAAALHADSTPQVNDTARQAALKYLLNFQQPDGGIYDRILPNYNTSIAVSALATYDSPRAKSATARAVEFLKKLQWSEFSVKDESLADSPSPITKDHVYYGGVGYGHHGRPDNSNLGMMLQALHDAGVSPDDPAFQRALTFLQRTQMLDSVNDMPYADGSKQGGFIYATVENAQSVEGRAGQSQAAEKIEETLDDGTTVSRLRCYGSMTYTGFKSYLYAQLSHDDPRVRAAYDWIRRNYSVSENPGLGDSGLYYYFTVMARALAAWGSPRIDTLAPDGSTAPTRWTQDLVNRLAELQNPDGSFKSVANRWMENNPVLITSYALIALDEAIRAEHKAAK
ncbi:MAG: prenyltransferase/squalene oxidase repeat-containing protein [Phycisphaerales bacterium]